LCCYRCCCPRFGPHRTTQEVLGCSFRSDKQVSCVPWRYHLQQQRQTSDRRCTCYQSSDQQRLDPRQAPAI
ncbi:MAG: hypothetical protein ACK56F_13910, partial [bacterium]